MSEQPQALHDEKNMPEGSSLSLNKGASLPSLKGLDMPARIPFTKMHGAGNDYIYVEEFNFPLPHPEALAVHISHRHFGVGDDGLVRAVRVNMGRPAFSPADIPMSVNTKDFINQELAVAGTLWRGTALSMGNPHLVIFVDDLHSLDLPRIGPLFENHAYFPERVNTEFIQVVDPKRIVMRVWERGGGETLACGTGACASLVACVLNEKTGPDITVSLPGGALRIEWEKSGNVFMTGPAASVCFGKYHVPQ